MESIRSITFKQWFQEMAGTSAIVGSCKPTADYQVWGACSDLKKKKKMSGMGNPGGIATPRYQGSK